MGKNGWIGGYMVVLMVAGVVARAPAPSSDCTSAITSLAPCLSYVSSGSNDTTPGKECCTALSTVVSTRVLCLCQVLSTNNTLGLPINRTRALALPSACNVKTPSISQCSVITPAASPTAKSPAPSAKTPASTVFTPAPAPTTSSPAPTTAAPSPSPSATPSAAPAPTSPTPMSSPSPQAPSPTVPTPSNPDTASPSPTSSPPSPTGGGAAGSSPSGGGHPIGNVLNGVL